MRSYEIDVKEFFMEDPPDYGDVFIPTPVPILTKKVQNFKEIHFSIRHTPSISRKLRKKRRHWKALSKLTLLTMMLRWLEERIQCYQVLTTKIPSQGQDLDPYLPTPSTTLNLWFTTSSARQRLSSENQGPRKVKIIQELRFPCFHSCTTHQGSLSSPGPSSPRCLPPQSPFLFQRVWRIFQACLPFTPPGI